MKNQTISLNFFPLLEQKFSFTVYIKKPFSSVQEEKSENIFQSRLIFKGDKRKSEYLTCFTKQPEYKQEVISSIHSISLTKRYLFSFLKSQAERNINSSDYQLSTHKFDKYKIYFHLNDDDLGTDTVWLRPYYLDVERSFGFLCGFHFFNKHHEGKIQKKSLIRSLSLNEWGGENRDYYQAYYKKIELFIGKYYPSLFPIETSSNSSLNIRNKLQRLESEQLKFKQYIVGQNRDKAKSQWFGIKNNGPIKKVQSIAKFYFLYPEGNREKALELATALRGKTYATFPGMEKIFGLAMSNNNVKGKEVQNFDTDTLSGVIEEIKEFAGNDQILPIIVTPWSKSDYSDNSTDQYYKLKHLFLSCGLPTQFVSLSKIKQKDGLKWAVSNIGLGIFSKLKGIPWEVEPESDKCLIIGIGQAHHKNKKGKIDKFFAYSVFTNSNGLFESINVLSQSENEEEYLNGLIENLKTTLKEYSKEHNKIVIHTPFYIRWKELEKIYQAINEFENENLSNKEIYVLKISERTDFIGFAPESHSYVPFESTYIRLSKKEYIVWFEGLQAQNRQVQKRYARPLHIEFLYPFNTIQTDIHKKCLQDALNLSGANWRGFNAKSLPISIYYAKQVSNFINHFDRLNLERVDIDNMSPWFL